MQHDLNREKIILIAADPWEQPCPAPLKGIQVRLSAATLEKSVPLGKRKGKVTD